MRILRDPIQWGAFLAAGVVVTLAAMPQARGELVYDDQPETQQAPVNREVIREDGREVLRQVILSSEKAQVSQAAAEAQAQAQAPAVTGLAPVQVVAAAEEAPAVENLSRTELLRRERLRRELRNEDILQERLEALRLKDEERRTEQLLAEEGFKKEDSQEPVAAAPMQQEYVVPPVTEVAPQERSYPAVDALAMTQAAPISAGAVLSAPVAPLAAQTSVDVSSGSADEELAFSIQPKGGISDMTSGAGYDVQPRFAAGLGLAVGVSDNLVFDAGYSYNEYGVALAPTNWYVQNALAWSGAGYYQGNLETVAMKQNVFDLGLRMHLLGRGSRVRPFLGGGGAYSKSFVNYDDRVLQMLRSQGLEALGSDYEVSSFLGYVSSGLDIRISKNLSVGATFKYYTVLTARENQPLNNFAMYAPGNYFNYGAYYNQLPDADKQMVGGSLARASFYSILAGVNFTF